MEKSFFIWNGLWHADRELARLVDLLQQIEGVEVAIHVVQRGEAVGGTVLEPALEDRPVARALRGGRRRIGLARLGVAKGVAPGGPGVGENVAEGARLAQLARCRAIGRHDDFGALRNLGPAENSGQLEGLRIGPDGMMIRAHHGEGPVGQHLVEILPRHIDAVADDIVGNGVCVNELVLGMLGREVPHSLGQVVDAKHRGQVEIFELCRTHENVNVTFD